jgi:hypothetical protein
MRVQILFLFDYQYRAWCQMHHLFGDTAQEHMGQPRPPVGSHDNEVSTTLVGNVHNRLRRGAGSDIHTPGTLEGGRHEVAQLCQGCLMVVLEHHHRLGWCGGA